MYKDGQRRRYFQYFLFGAIAVLIGGCGLSDSEETGPDEAEPTPLASFLGQREDPLFVGGASPDELNALLFQESMERELVIAGCMAEEGFDYVAYVPQSATAFRFSNELGIEPGTREWAEVFGFGVTTSAFAQSRVGPTLVGFDDRSIIESLGSNPNEEIMASLQDAEFDKYSQALYGQLPTVLDESDDDEPDQTYSEPQGCVGQSLSASSVSSSTRFRIEFANEIDDLYERVANDDRIVAFYDDLRTCVESEGFEFVEPARLVAGNSPWDAEIEELQAAVGAVDPLASVDLAEVEAMSPDELERFVDQQVEMSALGVELSTEFRARLEELQGRETSLAVAAFDCGGGGEDEFNLRKTVLRDLQSSFVSDYETRLADFRDS